MHKTNVNALLFQVSGPHSVLSSEYPERNQAEVLARDLQAEATECLGHSSIQGGAGVTSYCDGTCRPVVKYDVIEVPVTISGIEAVRDGQITVVKALVSLRGIQHITHWTAKAHETKSGVSGLEPAGDSVDAWTDPVLGTLLATDALVAVGMEILAMAGGAS